MGHGVDLEVSICAGRPTAGLSLHRRGDHDGAQRDAHRRGRGERAVRDPAAERPPVVRHILYRVNEQ